MSMSERRRTASPYADESWQPWEMAAFDAPAKAEPAVKTEPSKPLADTLSSLQQLRRTVRERAHAEGYASGHAEGLASGKDEGFLAGKKEGYDTGFSSGHNEGQAKAAQETRQLEIIAAACADAIASIESQTGQALISLAISIAQQVIRTTLEVDPGKILDIVRDIVHVDGNSDGILRLRVNPADLALIRAQMGDDPEMKNWRLLSDDSIERGGCIAETSLGDIDATLQTRWQRVIASLGRDIPWTRAS
ncbi:MAG TPA: flagellar assembly protein FliH [Eoetvoesiella sp.]